MRSLRGVSHAFPTLLSRISHVFSLSIVLKKNPGNSFVLIFLSFLSSFSPSSLFFSLTFRRTNCTDGYLKIFLKGQETQDAYDKFDYELCGFDIPHSVVSDGPRLAMVFSSGELQARGFKVRAADAINLYSKIETRLQTCSDAIQRVETKKKKTK